MIILDWTSIFFYWKWNESKTKIFFFHWTGNRLIFLSSTQNKTFLLWNKNKNKSEVKAEVKLICSPPGTAIQNNKKEKVICSWPGTAVQNRKSKSNMFMAGTVVLCVVTQVD